MVPHRSDPKKLRFCSQANKVNNTVYLPFQVYYLLLSFKRFLLKIQGGKLCTIGGGLESLMKLWARCMTMTPFCRAPIVIPASRGRITGFCQIQRCCIPVRGETAAFESLKIEKRWIWLLGCLTLELKAPLLPRDPGSSRSAPPFLSHSPEAWCKAKGVE